MFFVLYSTGVGSEALINFATLPMMLLHCGMWFDVHSFMHWEGTQLMTTVIAMAQQQ